MSKTLHKLCHLINNLFLFVFMEPAINASCDFGDFEGFRALSMVIGVAAGAEWLEMTALSARSDGESCANDVENSASSLSLATASCKAK